MSGEGLLADSGRPRLADPITVDLVAEIVRMTLGSRRRGRRDVRIDFTDPLLELRADLGADELDMVSIAVDMEERLGRELSDDAIARTRTIGDLQRFAIGGDI